MAQYSAWDDLIRTQKRVDEERKKRQSQELNDWTEGRRGQNSSFASERSATITQNSDAVPKQSWIQPVIDTAWERTFDAVQNRMNTINTDLGAMENGAFRSTTDLPMLQPGQLTGRAPYQNPLALGGPNRAYQEQKREDAWSALQQAKFELDNARGAQRHAEAQRKYDAAVEESKRWGVPTTGAERAGRAMAAGGIGVARALTGTAATAAKAWEEKESQLFKTLPGGNNPAGVSAASQFENAYDLLARKAEQQTETAKRGLGAVGKALVDAGVTGTEMAVDALINLAGGVVGIPAAGLGMLGVRSFGDASQRARMSGASAEQATAYGMAVATVELLTEKLFGAGSEAAYGKGLLDKPVETLLKKFGDKGAGKYIGQILAATGEEAFEEGAAGIIDPLFELIYSDASLRELYNSDMWSETAYEMLIGGLLGFVGGHVELACEATSLPARIVRAENQYLDACKQYGADSKEAKAAGEKFKALYAKEKAQEIKAIQKDTNYTPGSGVNKELYGDLQSDAAPDVLDRATTEYMKLGGDEDPNKRGTSMNLETAQKKAAIIDKAMNGETLTPIEINALDLTNAGMREVFNNVTGLQLDESVNTLLNQTNGRQELSQRIQNDVLQQQAREMAAREGEQRARYFAKLNAENLVDPRLAANVQVDNYQPLSYNEFEQAFQARSPGANADNLYGIYEQYLGEVGQQMGEPTVSVNGVDMNRFQFISNSNRMHDQLGEPHSDPRVLRQEFENLLSDQRDEREQTRLVQRQYQRQQEQARAQMQEEVFEAAKRSGLLEKKIDVGQSPMNYEEFAEYLRTLPDGDAMTDAEITVEFLGLANEQGAIDSDTYDKLMQEVQNERQRNDYGKGLHGNADQHSEGRTGSVSGNAEGAEAPVRGRGAADNAGGRGGVGQEAGGVSGETSGQQEDLSDLPTESTEVGGEEIDLIPDEDFLSTNVGRDLTGKFNSIGLRVRAFLGTIRILDKDGKVVKYVVGKADLGGDTYLCADDPNYMLRQLGGHELGHQVFYLDPGSFVRAKEAFLNAVSAEDLQKFKRAYTKEFEGAYRASLEKRGIELTDDLLTDMIIEEILCDANGRMDRAGTNASAYYDVVAPIIEQAQQAEEYARVQRGEAYVPIESLATQDTMGEGLVNSLEADDLNEATVYSVSSLAKSAGLKAVEENGEIYYMDSEGNKLKEVSPDVIRNSPIGAVLKFAMENKWISEADYETQIKFFADVCSITAKTKDFFSTSAFLGAEMFTAIKANSDKQYGTTYDFKSVCIKTQACIDAMSKAMVDKKRALETDEIMKIYKAVNEIGLPVSCPECYVWNRWIGIGGLLDNIWKYQKKYSAMSVDEVIQTYNDTLAKVTAKAEEAGLTAGRAKTKLLDKIEKDYKKLKDKIELAQNTGAEVKAADTTKLAKIEDMLTEVRSLNWIKNVYFAGKPMTKANVNPNYFVPAEILFDLNRGAEFASDKYRAAWKFRTTQGAGYGKAITPYADAVLGEGIMGIANLGRTIDEKAEKGGKITNPILDSRGELTNDARKALTAAVRKQKAQLFRGGQRFNSTSDAGNDVATDYLIALLEMQTMHGGVQCYTKVDGSVRMLAQCGAFVNQSLMPLGGGLSEDGKTARDTRAGGMAPEAAFENRKLYPTAGTITIGVNDNHIRVLFNDVQRDFVIPYHASGGKTETVAEMRKAQDPDAARRMVRSTDYTKMQTDKVLSDLLLADYYGYDAGHINQIHKNRAARLAILTAGRPDMSVVAANPFLQELYDKFHGGEWDGVRLTKSECESNIYPNEFWDETVDYDHSGVNTQRYLDYCESLGFLHKFSGKYPAATKKGGKASSTLRQAKGYNEKGEEVELTDLAYKYKDGKQTGEIEPFFWKSLVDHRMYGNGGEYLKQGPIDLTKLMPSGMSEEESIEAGAQTVRDFAKYNTGKPYDAKRSAELQERINDILGSKLSVTEDSTGRKLTEQQQEYFAESKVRDDEGRLTPVYHGTPAGGFNTFEMPQFLSKLMSSYGGGFYFTTNKQQAELYTKAVNKTKPKGARKKIYEAYLNITNPLELSAKDKPKEFKITKDQLRELIRRGDREWFKTNGMAFDAGFTHQAEKEAAAKMSFEELLDHYVGYQFAHALYTEDLLSEAVAAYEGGSTALLDAMRDVLGYDGVKYTYAPDNIFWVAWGQNQIKNVNNKTPTESTDIRYSVAGEQATKADLGKLSQARQLDQNGATAEETWRKTGWWKGKDGKWRFEINDKDMKLKSWIPNKRGKLSDFIEHDELFENYPFLRDVDVVRDLPAGSVKGNSGPGREIHLQSDKFLYGDELKSIIAHEAQHLIQRYEDFATGANMPIAYHSLFINTLKGIVNDPKKWSAFKNISTYQGRVRRIEREMLKQSTDPAFQNSAEEKMFDALWVTYASAIGEQEARDVQARLNMDEAERQATVPYLAQAGLNTTRRQAIKDKFHELHELLGQPTDKDGKVLVDKLSSPLYNALKKGGNASGDLDLEREAIGGSELGARTAGSDKRAGGDAVDLRGPGEDIHSQLNEQALRNALTEAPATAGASSMPTEAQQNEADTPYLDDIAAWNESYEKTRAALAETYTEAQMDDHDIAVLRDRVADLRGQLDLAEVNDIGEVKERELRAEIGRKQIELNKLLTKERRLAKQTSINNILANLDAYRRSDLESLAEQVSDGAWDGYEELSDDELREALRETLTERAQDLSELERQAPKYGFYVRPTDNIRYSVSPPVDTPAFRNWFKDSKVVNEDGTPKVMYHGTSSSGFRMFDTYGGKFGLFGIGSYFTDDPDVASSYTKKGHGKAPGVYPVYLSIQNPIDMDAPANIEQWRQAFEENDWGVDYLDGVKTNEDAYRALLDVLQDEGYYQYDGEETAQDVIRFMGYDGITHIGGGRYGKKDGPRHRVYIVFDPEQVKSIYNQGTWDPDNTDIRYSVSPDMRARLDAMHAQYGKNDGLGAADRGTVNTAYDNLQAQSKDFHPSGPSPVRHTDVPKTDFEGRNIPKSTSTIYGAAATPDSSAKQLEGMIAKGELSFDTETDVNAVNKAKRTMNGKGFDGALEQYRNNCNAGVASKENTALGQQLLIRAMQEGNDAAVAELLSLYTRNSTTVAQALQAQSMFRKLSPEGQLVGLRKAIEALNEKYGTELGMTENEVKDFTNAGSQAEREKVHDRIVKRIADLLPKNFKSKFDAIRYLAMLGNPRTHIRNILGNTFFQAPVAMKNRVGALGEIIANAVSGGKVERTKSLTGVKSRALIKEAQADFLKVKNQLGNISKYNEGKSVKSEIEQQAPAFSNSNIVGKTLNKLSEGNSALLEGEDMAFKRFIYVQSLAGYLQANGVKSIAEAEKSIEGRKLLARARNYAAQEAMRNTFNDRNKFSDWIASFGKGRNSDNAWDRAKGYVVEGVLPFKRTPANILARAVEYSPVGAMNGIVELVKGAKSSDATQITKGIDRLAAGLSGSALMYLGYVLAGMGKIRGGEDDDEKQKNFDSLRGHQNYSLETSDGKSFTLDWLAPEAIPFFMGVELYNAALEKGMSFDDVRKVFKNANKPMLEMSMLQGLHDLFENAAYAKNNGDSVGFMILAGALTSYVSQVFPTIFGQGERAFGENQRMTTYTDKNSPLPTDWQYTLGKVSQKVPGWDYNQIPYIDAWGRAEDTGGRVERILNNFIKPYYTSEVSMDKMEDELQRLYDVTGENVLPQRADRKVKINGEDYNLSGEEYVKYAMTKGALSYNMVADLMSSKGYQNLSDEEKARCISKLYEYANAKAKEQVFGLEPADTEMQSFDKAVSHGISPAEYVSYKAQIAELKPEPGHSSVSRMQQYRTIDATGMSKDAKAYAIGSIMGLDLTTEAGNKSQYAKMLDLLNSGLSVTQYLNIKEEHDRIEDGGGTSTEQATQFVLWVNKQNWLNDTQKNMVKEYMPYSYGGTAEANKGALAAGEHGISDETYANLYSKTQGISSLKDEKGDTVTNSKSLLIMQAIYEVPGLTSEQVQFLAEALGVGKTVRGYSKAMVNSKLNAMRNKYGKYN